MSVEYRDIPGYPGYRVGDDGSVWSRVMSPEWKRLNPTTNKDGYHVVSVRSNGRRKQMFVHRLILLAFIGESCLVTRHLNGKRNDNRLLNLRYGTHQENANDRIAHGASGVGEKNPKAKLTESQVIEAISLARGGMARAKIAKMFGVQRAAINKIVWRTTWKHLQVAS